MPDSGPRIRRTIALALATAFVLTGVFAAGRLTAPQAGTPTNTSVEAGFARDMQTHHEQAVDLSMTIRDLTEDPDVRTLAYDVAMTQSNQAGQLYGWLSEWKLPQASPEPIMTWMTRPTLSGETHGHASPGAASDGETGAPSTRTTPSAPITHRPGGPMPGLATPEQIGELRTLAGVAAEQHYLALMIAHHIGGVDMAEALLDRSTYRSTANFARAVVASQTSEIDLMERMLAERS